MDGMNDGIREKSDENEGIDKRQDTEHQRMRGRRKIYGISTSV